MKNKLNLNILTNKETIEKGRKTIEDIIMPDAIDFRNPMYLIADSTYISGLIVTNYLRTQDIGWIEPLFNLDIDVDISMFYEKLDSAKIIRELTYHIGNVSSALRTVAGNQQDIDLMETTYDDAKYIRKEMQVNKEELYYLYLYISVFNESQKELEFNLQKIEGICGGIGLTTRRAIFRQEQMLKASLPLFINSDDIKQSARRNILSSSLVSTYPFMSSELCDNSGIMLGYNEHNKSMVIIDRFNSKLYKNANMCVLGTSGAGKSYLVKLMVLRNRYLDITQLVIDPDREYLELAKALDASIIKLSLSSDTYINIFDIREQSLDGEGGFLADKLGKLHIFFSFIFNNISEMEMAYLDEKLVKMYELKGITFDDNTLYEENNEKKLLLKKKFKSPDTMPILEDLYELLVDDENTYNLAVQLKPYVSGSFNFFNHHTNVDLNNKLIIADINDLDDKLMPIGMFMIMDIFWDKIKEDRSEKKIIYMDELWRLIGSTGNEKSAEFVYKIFKSIRKYGGGATAITQDIADFFALENGKYGRAIINNATLKFLLQLEEDDIKTLKNVLNLSEEETIKIRNFERGSGIFYAGKNHIEIRVEGSEKEHSLITTDRSDLERLKNREKISK